MAEPQLRDTFVCMANNLCYQQELIVLSVLHTTSEAEICNFSPLQKRDEEYPGLFLGEFPPPPPRVPFHHPRPCQHLPRRNSSVSRKNRKFLSSQWESTHDLDPDYW